MKTQVFAFCVAFLTATAVAGQTQPTLEVLARQGDYYWVVSTAADGSRRAGWVSASTALDRIDRKQLAALPRSASNYPQTAPPDARPSERESVEDALAAHGDPQGASNTASASEGTSARRRADTTPIQQRGYGEGRRFHAGTLELMASGGFTGTSVEGVSASAVNLTTFLGVFATRRVELGISTEVTKVEGLDTVGAVMGHFFFNFPNNSAIVPFLGVGLGTTSGYADIVGHPMTLDLSGGFRVMTPGGGGAFVVRPFYQRAAVGSDYIDTVVNTWGVSIGASLLF